LPSVRVRERIQRAFQKADLKNAIHVLRDGEEAINYLNGLNNVADESLQSPMPALMLLDLKMPRKTGFEVLEWLRQQPNLKRLIVIVLTSSNQPVDINHAYDLRANSYLVKPADFVQLIEMAKNIKNYWLAHNLKPETEASAGGVPAPV
jgi:CheY-like chemotaxis protein